MLGNLNVKSFIGLKTNPYNFKIFDCVFVRPASGSRDGSAVRGPTRAAPVSYI